MIFKCAGDSRYRYFEPSLFVELFDFYFDFNSFDLRRSVAVVSEVFAKASTFTSSENFKVTSPLLLIREILSVTFLSLEVRVSLWLREPLINC